ncbi:acylneuraminate cytidylyltransferase family protein [Candidatus Parcubacteria bacterium]|nr:MAG: acylneuraminate cytidylyltransferase family protein [Candidatus Parcubacteria bacterium]
MKILGIIPARGGSKSIPRKNIKDLGGKPLIAWTIEAAKQAGVFDRIILTTDDDEIAAVGKQWGIEVPFMRPKEFAEDKTPTLPVLQHAVQWLKDQERYEPDAIMLLQPTAPFRQAAHIRDAVKVFSESGADSLVSVVEIPGHYSPYWAEIIDEEGWGSLFIGGPIKSRIPRRQDFPQKTYTHNGAIYLFRAGLLFDSNEPSLYGNRVKLYPVEERYSVNIDSPEDWHLAERAAESFKS